VGGSGLKFVNSLTIIGKKERSFSASFIAVVVGFAFPVGDGVEGFFFRIKVVLKEELVATEEVNLINKHFFNSFPVLLGFPSLFLIMIIRFNYEQILFIL
jgi:hypothetical protein